MLNPLNFNSPRADLQNTILKSIPIINRLQKQQNRERDYSPSNVDLSSHNFENKLQLDWKKNLNRLNEIRLEIDPLINEIENYGYDENEIASPIEKGKAIIDQFNNFVDEGIPNIALTKKNEWNNLSEDVINLYHEMKDAYEDGNKIKFENIKNQLIPLAEKTTIFVRKLTKNDNVPANDRTSTLNILKKAQELWQKDVPVVLPHAQPNNLENQIAALKAQRPRNNKDVITRDQHLRSGLPVPEDVQQRLNALVTLNAQIKQLEQQLEQQKDMFSVQKETQPIQQPLSQNHPSNDQISQLKQLIIKRYNDVKTRNNGQGGHPQEQSVLWTYNDLLNRPNTDPLWVDYFKQNKGFIK